MRLDQFLTIRGIIGSRNKAADAIRNGKVEVNGAAVLKPSFEVSESDRIVLRQSEPAYVARSAKKLLRAFEVFDLNWQGQTAADLGASTGGFCQVLLEKGVKRVYAVDVGTAQLHPTIASDPRIINMEKTNAKLIDASFFPEPIDAVTADLSFISITLIIPRIFLTLKEEGEAILLIKPQFEAGKEFLNKSGVVTDLKTHEKVLKTVAARSGSCGFCVKGISFSGLAGESGNREYLLYLKKCAGTSQITEIDIHNAVYNS